VFSTSFVVDTKQCATGAWSRAPASPLHVSGDKVVLDTSVSLCAVLPPGVQLHQDSEKEDDEKSFIGLTLLVRVTISSRQPSSCSKFAIINRLLCEVWICTRWVVDDCLQEFVVMSTHVNVDIIVLLCEHVHDDTR